jgi:hypothetical protein
MGEVAAAAEHTRWYTSPRERRGHCQNGQCKNQFTHSSPFVMVPVLSGHSRADLLLRANHLFVAAKTVRHDLGMDGPPWLTPSFGLLQAAKKGPTRISPIGVFDFPNYLGDPLARVIDVPVTLLVGAM